MKQLASAYLIAGSPFIVLAVYALIKTNGRQPGVVALFFAAFLIFPLYPYFVSRRRLKKKKTGSKTLPQRR
ncbi:MAG: hypothetical protein Q7Q73_18600 [Verrucomicrobiota bacterium JB024]|jgi:hypothetical protein|nr:hypothetical protein [Verrucomicrobiota bacterium JB024]